MVGTYFVETHTRQRRIQFSDSQVEGMPRRLTLNNPEAIKSPEPLHAGQVAPKMMGCFYIPVVRTSYL